MMFLHDEPVKIAFGDLPLRLGRAAKIPFRVISFESHFMPQTGRFGYAIQEVTLFWQVILCEVLCAFKTSPNT